MNILSKDINAYAYQYQASVQDRFESICKPLFKLGVKYFLYLKIFRNGNYLFFVNNRRYLDTCLEVVQEPGEMLTAYINRTKRESPQHILLPSNPDTFDKRKEPVLQIAYDFNIWNMFAIFKGSQEDFIRVYSFAGDRNDLLLHNFYLNHIGLLYHFCDYFDERAIDLVDCRDKRQLFYLKLEKPFTFYNNPQEEALKQTVEEFLRNTQIKKKILRFQEGGEVLLSKREIECLTHLSLGKTSKEIARTLNLSPRTVEFYFQNMKQKTGLKRGALLTALMNNRIID